MPQGFASLLVIAHAPHALMKTMKALLPVAVSALTLTALKPAVKTATLLASWGFSCPCPVRELHLHQIVQRAIHVIIGT